MNTRLWLYFLILFTLSITSAEAQLEGSNWHFGTTSKGLYFSPSAIPSVTNISYTPYGAEGCSVLSDPTTGALKFYTDGIRVVDAGHVLMPNGSGLLGLVSSEGSGKIVQDPGNCNRYFVFSNSCAFEVGSSTKKLYYSVVDMTLPGNGTVAIPKGDVVAGLKNIIVASNVSEGVEIIPETNTHNFWVVTTANSPSSVSVYKFTASSITFVATYPLMSSLTDIRPITYCKANNKIAVGSMIDFDKTLLLDFNPATGAVTSQSIIPGLPVGTMGIYYGIYGLAWSEDGTKLYISKYRIAGSGGKLYQYNLTTSVVTLLFSCHPSSVSFSARGLKMGPDGKIYFLYMGVATGIVNYLGAINFPNAAGLACSFNPTQIAMGSDLGSTHKFPDFLYSNNKLLNNSDSTIAIVKACNSLSDTTLVNINKPLTDIDADLLSYQVIGSTFAGATATFTGTSVIQYINSAPLPLTDTLTIMYCDNYCISKCDTFKVILNITTTGTGSLSLPASLSSCIGNTQVIDAGPGLFNYSWSNGDSTQTTSVLANGIYNVTAEDSNGCLYSDSVNVFFNPPPIPDLGNDTSICGDLILSIAPFSSINWSSGNTGQIDTINSSGLYYVNVTDMNGCTANDSINLIINAPPLVFVGNDTAVCGNSSLTLSTNQVFPSILWNNGITTQINTINTSGLYYALVTDINGCSSADSINIIYNTSPIVDLGNDTALCSDLILSVNSFPFINWNNGTVGQLDTINTSGLYYVNVTDLNGCSANDSINLIINSPPIVFVGNDTAVCGSPSIILSTNQPFPSILWNNGTTTQINIINTSGLYYAVVTDSNGCSSSDSINITFNSNPAVDLGSDTSACNNWVLIVNPFPVINWSNGDSLQTDTITSSGTYYVIVSDMNGCSSGDTINIAIDYSPLINIGGPYYFCSNTAIAQTLYTTGAASVIWSTGSINDSIIVNSAGTYSVIASSAGGCSSVDSTEVLIMPTPVSSLPTEYAGCPVNFDAGTAAFYFWSTTETSSSIYIQTSGNYSVAMTGTNGCISLFNIYVTIDNADADYLSKIPNVFTPNGDLQNDYFKINNVFNACTKFRSIIVFNRWGKKMFESENPDFEWDGKYNGEDLPEGVYYGLIENGESEKIRTDAIFISILR